MEYVFEHKGKAYTPNGITSVSNVDEHNKEAEQVELMYLSSHPDRLFLYVKHGDMLATEYRSWSKGHTDIAITTWLGTSVATHVWIGPRRQIGFGYDTYRRPVSCRINGVQYHGWYMESSGNYCRLRKAKKQPSN